MEATALPRQGTAPAPHSRRVLAALGDGRLVDLVRRGHDAAFEVLYDRHHRAILAFCRHMLGSREEAEDAVQHTFMSAYGSLLGSDRDIALKPWLFTIARNRCLSVLRARREEVADEVELSTAGLPDEVERRSELRHLLADVAALPDEQRAALVLAEIGDLSHADIAQVLGCEVGKVKSLIFQARSSLIETRKAREVPCVEIRAQLATLSGGALRRGVLRRHLRSCAGCREYRHEVKRQRALLAAALPVVPSFGLKESALAAVGIGGGGGAAAAGGGLGAVLATGAAKVATVAVVAGGAAGGLAATDAVELPGGGRGSVEQVAPAGAGASTLPGDRAAPSERAAGSAHVQADLRAERKAAGEQRGFTPLAGEPNGEAAGDFARERGDGQKLGLKRESRRSRPPRPERWERRPTPPPPPATQREPAKAQGAPLETMPPALLEQESVPSPPTGAKRSER
jgi:RNA polymerase sigma factor (sigma-70 family)